jgi:glycosyltransferase involved in cell wall biosynthesis
MKVLVVFDNFYPEGMAMSNRLHLYAKGLVEVGTKVRILALKARSKSFDIQNFEGVEYYNLKTGFQKGIPNFLKRIGVFIERIYLYKHLFKEIKNYDVIWAIDFSWFPLLIISMISKIHNKKIVIELNELPNSIIASRLQSNFSNSIKRQLLFKIAYPKINGFIVISEALELLANNKKSSSAKVIRIPILMDKEKFSNYENKVENRFKNRFVLHAGTLTEEKDGIIEVFEAIARVIKENDPQLKFILSNKITLPKVIGKIDKIIENYGIKENVIFHNHISKIELDKYLKTCTFAIINKPNTERNSYNFSTKLGEYLSYGIPVITTPVGESSRYLVDRINAHIINSDDINGLIQRIIEILESPETAINLANRGRETAIDNFDYRLYSKDLLNFFSSLK